MPEPIGRRHFVKLAVGGALAPLALARAASAQASAEGALTAITWIEGIAGQERELEEHLLSLAAPTRAEPGCLLYDLYRSADDPPLFVRIEVWRSEADLEAHKAAPHIRASFARRQREGWTTNITLWKRLGP
jgi:quinol monooxygenase YgiN